VSGAVADLCFHLPPTKAHTHTHTHTHTEAHGHTQGQLIKLIFAQYAIAQKCANKKYKH